MKLGSCVTWFVLCSPKQTEEWISLTFILKKWRKRKELQERVQVKGGGWGRRRGSTVESRKHTPTTVTTAMYTGEEVQPQVDEADDDATAAAAMAAATPRKQQSSD